MTRLPSPRRLLHAGGVALLAAVLAVVLATAVPQAVGADHSFVVLSGSMEPAISPGDVVFVREVPASAVETGSVVTYRRADAGRTTHRVVDVVERDGRRYLRTRGDANEEADPQLVPADAVVGEVLVVLPYVGHLLLFADTRLGVVVLVFVPAGLLVANELWTLASAVRRGGESTAATEGDE